MAALHHLRFGGAPPASFGAGFDRHAVLAAADAEPLELPTVLTPDVGSASPLDEMLEAS